MAPSVLGRGRVLLALDCRPSGAFSHLSQPSEVFNLLDHYHSSRKRLSFSILFMTIFSRPRNYCLNMEVSMRSKKLSLAVKTL